MCNHYNFDLYPDSSVFCNRPALPETDKRYIVRIETPDGRLGTGFILCDSTIGYFLVTNKHMLMSSKTQEYFDSVYVRNNILREGKVIATDEAATVYLTYRGTNLYKEHEDPDIDLILVRFGWIPVADTTIYNPKDFGPWMFGYPMYKVADRSTVDSLKIRDGTRVQLIGFSFQASQKPQFHISRFGHIALFAKEKITRIINRIIMNCQCLVPMTSEWIILDITSRRGDSGGPVFAIQINLDYALLIGFVQGGSELKEFCLVQPSYYIWDLVESIKETK